MTICRQDGLPCITSCFELVQHQSTRAPRAKGGGPTPLSSCIYATTIMGGERERAAGEARGCENHMCPHMPLNMCLSYWCYLHGYVRPLAVMYNL